MKKIILVLFTGLCFAENAQAQGVEINNHKFRFGAYVAPTMSWMRPTSSKDDSGTFGSINNGSKLGYTWGLMVDRYISDNYIIATGLQLNTSGGKIVTTRTTPDSAIGTVQAADFDYRFQFIEIPLALKLRTDNVNGFKFFGQVGITAGFNLQKVATYKVNYNDENGVAQVKEGTKEKLKGTLVTAPVLFQMNIGAGLEYPLSTKLTAYVGVFFNNGFAPDMTNPDKYELNYAGTFKDGHTRLNNFALRLGLYF